jgi:predicted GIY-YIG superfamily endonuclease
MNRYARPENFASRIRTPLLREHFVYRAYATDGHLLYVGCTYDPPARMAAHRGESQWFHLATSFKMCGPYNYETARQLESDAINSERPQFNYTSEKRILDKIRSRMIDRGIQVLLSTGVNLVDAIGPAVDAVNLVLPSQRDERITDLMIPNARRIEREYMESLERAA